MATNFVDFLPANFCTISMIFMTVIPLMAIFVNIIFYSILNTETNSILKPYKWMLIQNCVANICFSVFILFGKALGDSIDGRQIYLSPGVPSSWPFIFDDITIYLTNFLMLFVMQYPSVIFIFRYFHIVR